MSYSTLEESSSLLGYLSTQQSLERAGNGHKDWVYHGLADFVVREGRSWEPAPLPSDVGRGKLKACFRNAVKLMLRRPDLVYVEGYAAGIIPVLHAWCVDSDGKVVDPTWDDGIGTEYFGVPFNRAFVMTAVVDKGSYGLIDDMNGRWSLLRQGGDGWKAATTDSAILRR